MTKEKELATQNQSVEKQIFPGLSRDAIQLLKDSIAKGATDLQLSLFLAVCNRRQLDPFKNQIYAVMYKDDSGNETLVPTVSVNGLLTIAARGGRYQGHGQYEWMDDDGNWTQVWIKPGPPAAARVAVFGEGLHEPVVGIVHYHEMVKTKNVEVEVNGKKEKRTVPFKMWATMPARMLAKCALAQALREAFPNDCEGIYITEEFGEIHPYKVTDADKARVGSYDSGGGSDKQPDFDTPYTCPLCKKGKLFVTDGKWGPSYKCHACGKFPKKADRDAADLPDPKSLKPPEPVTEEQPEDEAEPGESIKDVANEIGALSKKIDKETFSKIAKEFKIVGKSLSMLTGPDWPVERLMRLRDAMHTAIPQDVMFDDNGGAA